MSVELTEAQLHNLGGSGRNYDSVIKKLKGVIVRHFYYNHKFPQRAIAKELGMKMKEVKECLFYPQEN